MEHKDKIVIYTDGSASPNPGIGGWAAILTMPSLPYKARLREKIVTGGELQSTNNRMELTAVIEALSVLNYPCDVTVYTDSQYVSNAFVKNWIGGWVEKKWFDVKNSDLWKRLLELTKKHNVTWEWVRGHSNHPENERCDKLAVEARLKIANGIDKNSATG